MREADRRAVDRAEDEVEGEVAGEVQADSRCTKGVPMNSSRTAAQSPRRASTEEARCSRRTRRRCSSRGRPGSRNDRNVSGQVRVLDVKAPVSSALMTPPPGWARRRNVHVELDAGCCTASCRERVVVHEVFDLRRLQSRHVAVPSTMSLIMPKMKSKVVATRTAVRVAGRAIDHRPVQLAIRLPLTPRGAVPVGSRADVQAEEPQWVELSMQESM